MTLEIHAPDSYYLIRKHPRGGYAAVLTFLCWDIDDPPEAEDWRESFVSIMRALRWALTQEPEHGVLIHPECDGYVRVP